MTLLKEVNVKDQARNSKKDKKNGRVLFCKELGIKVSHSVKPAHKKDYPSHELEDVFKAISNIVEIIYKQRGEILTKELEIIFRLINARKYGLKMYKQLSCDLSQLAPKPPELAKALENLREKASNYPEPIDFNQIIKYSLFCKRDLVTSS